MHSQKKKDREQMINLDYNSNVNPNTRLGYTQLRSLTVPNLIVSTLQNAADEFNFSPVSSRQVVMPTSERSPQSGIPAPTSNQKVPLVTTLSFTQGLADQRRKKINMQYMANAERITSRPSNGSKEHYGQAKHDTTVNSENILQWQHMQTVQAHQTRKQTPSKDWLNFWCNNEEVREMMKGPPRCLPLKPDPDVCYCNRPKRTVWCIMCGFHVKGNVRTICLQHPQMSFLYQWDRCGNPKCKAPNLLTEIDLDYY